jgi:hypothetical protein
MSGGWSSKKSMANGRQGKGYQLGKTPSVPVAIGASAIKRARKETKMKLTLKQRFRNWLMNDDDEYSMPINVVMEDEHDIRSDDAINFTVINAAGGRIVKVSYYDQRNDRNRQSLHLITPDENLAESLAHILTLETLGK